MEFTGAIIFCPLCCTNYDVTDPKQTEFECVNCEQTWNMVLDVQRLAQHSMA